MIRAIRAGRTPSLFVLGYTDRWEVRHVLLIPSFFFTESAIERRRPLSISARRAGWVGCNINLHRIAADGKILLVMNGAPAKPSDIRSQFERVRPLALLPARVRGWALDVLRVVQSLGIPRFNLADVYAKQEALARLHPDNRNIRPKIRQQLQVLRDLGLLQFHGAGVYELSGTGRGSHLHST